MTDNGATLTVDAQGYIHWGTLRLLVRYEDGKLWFPVKHPGDQARLKCKRVGIPIGEFDKLEISPAPTPCRSAGRMPRDSRRRTVAPHNRAKQLTKLGEM